MHTIEESIEELIDEFGVVLKNGKPDSKHGGQIQLKVSICLRLVFCLCATPPHFTWHLKIAIVARWFRATLKFVANGPLFRARVYIDITTSYKAKQVKLQSEFE